MLFRSQQQQLLLQGGLGPLPGQQPVPSAGAAVVAAAPDAGYLPRQQVSLATGHALPTAASPENPASTRAALVGGKQRPGNGAAGAPDAGGPSASTAEEARGARVDGKSRGTESETREEGGPPNGKERGERQASAVRVLHDLADELGV